MFAGVLMLVEGVFGVLGGIAAIAEDDVYTRIGDYVYKFNLTTWGWIHLILGVIVAFVGWGILQGAAWARGVGVGLAAVVMVAQFLWLPYQPLWALISIALALFVIWALCTDRGRTASV
jgi:multisubunit Na+/H+ antiporter MnhG subunit